MSLLICDTEADNLLPYASKVHCISYKFVGQPVRTLTPDTLSEWKQIPAQADEIVCHNIVGYDLVLWLKCGLIDSFTVGPDSINGRKVKITDSLVLSRYINPDRIGGHGLEAWGERTGVAKPKHEDWSQYSEAMRVRCEQDVLNNERVYKMLQEEMR